MTQIYLDYAAATPLHEEVLLAMQPYLQQAFHNPSSTYLDGKAVRKALEAARQTVAQTIGARAAEVTFTAGATEANNLAIQGVMRRYPEAEVLVAATEHELVLAPAGLFKHRLIAVDKEGRVDPTNVAKMVNDRTVMVSVGLINNEIGTLQPLGEISKLLNKLSNSRGPKALPLIFHSDAAQAPNYLDLNVARLGVDLLSLNGGKIYGPKQSGALYVRTGIQLQPLILGGGQEGGLRSGTENVPAIIGFATALQLAQDRCKDEAKRVTSLRLLFISEIAAKLPKAFINGGDNSAPHIISLTIPGTDNERLMMELDERGLQVATGSACSASTDEPSHVLGAIGLDASAARATLRLSFGQATTASHVRRVVRDLAELTDSQR